MHVNSESVYSRSRTCIVQPTHQTFCMPFNNVPTSTWSTLLWVGFWVWKVRKGWIPPSHKSEVSVLRREREKSLGILTSSITVTKDGVGGIDKIRAQWVVEVSISCNVHSWTRWWSSPTYLVIMVQVSTVHCHGSMEEMAQWYKVEDVCIRQDTAQLGYMYPVHSLINHVIHAKFTARWQLTCNLEN